MTVLVTGGAGFVGLNVVEALREGGEAVVVLDRIGPPTSLGSAGREATFARGDVGDAAMLADLFREHSIDRVVHAAAVTSDAAREARDPGAIIDVNVTGTLTVLAAAREAGCRRFVYIGSGAAYGATHLEGRMLHEETSASRPQDVYGATKLAAEGIALRLGDLWDVDVVAVRLGSVFGPWEFGTGVRDTLSAPFQAARLAVRGEAAILPPVEIWRDWVYSRDVAGGLAAILTHGPAPAHRVYHLSSRTDWRGAFVQFCEALRAAYPSFSWRMAEDGEAPNVDFRSLSDRSPMDVGRLSRDIGFTARFSPSEAYADYVAWIGAHEEVLRPPSRDREPSIVART